MTDETIRKLRDPVAPHICAERDELAEKIAEAINGMAK